MFFHYQVLCIPLFALAGFVSTSHRHLTERYGKGARRNMIAGATKLLRYQAKLSVQEIVLISQYVQHVEVITRILILLEIIEMPEEE